LICRKLFCGRGSVVERLLAKEKVVGSNPIARSHTDPVLPSSEGGVLVLITNVTNYFKTFVSFVIGKPGSESPLERMRKTFIFFQIYVIMELRVRERMC
jgi:hypothetical protein